jgi:sigma-B regulation protein RsbU (phosphoserine phosphatase)
VNILVSDDQPDVREALRLLLKGAGYQAETVDHPKALLQVSDSREFDLILMDLNYTRDTTSGDEGLQTLAALRDRGNRTPVVVMTAWGSVDLAVEAMRQGAVDFVQKPWDNARLLDTLERRSERPRFPSEMDIARSVQQKLFPREAIPLATLDYAGICMPAKEIGGDYYDYLDLGSGRIGFVLADVSGKGTGAALLMANLQGLFRSRVAADWDNAPAVLAALNRTFFHSTPVEQYATVFFGQYDDSTREFRYVNCGQHAPILMHATGAAERLEATSMPLGLFTDWHGSEQSITLREGDRLLLFSDGVVEAGVDTGQEFGEARIVEQAAELAEADAATLVGKLARAVREYALLQHDDVTIVGLKAREDLLV